MNRRNFVRFCSTVQSVSLEKKTKKISSFFRGHSEKDAEVDTDDLTDDQRFTPSACSNLLVHLRKEQLLDFVTTVDEIILP